MDYRAYSKHRYIWEGLILGGGGVRVHVDLEQLPLIGARVMDLDMDSGWGV